MRILVCHASIHGSTAEIAKRLATKLREREVTAHARATTNRAPSDDGEPIERRSREESVVDVVRSDDPTVGMSTHGSPRDRRLEEPSEDAASELVDGAT